MKLAKNPPSKESQIIQAALNKAIANALEKKTQARPVCGDVGKRPGSL